MMMFRASTAILLLLSTLVAHAAETLDLGTTSVESSIRRPNTDLIEGSETLKTAACKVLKTAYEEIEQSTLSRMGEAK